MSEQVQVSQKAIKLAYKLYEQKKFGTIGKLCDGGHYNKEFFVHFSVKQLAHMDDRNSQAGSLVPELMKSAKFDFKDVVKLSAEMASNKMDGGKLGKAQDYINVLMRFVEEYGTPAENDRAVFLRDKLERLMSDASKKASEAKQVIDKAYSTGELEHGAMSFISPSELVGHAVKRVDKDIKGKNYDAASDLLKAVSLYVKSEKITGYSAQLESLQYMIDSLKLTEGAFC